MRLFAVCQALFSVVSVSACNTVQGVDKGLEAASEGIEKACDKK